MEIYKLSISNKDINIPDLYFQDQETAGRVMAFFDSITKKGKKIKWKAEIINVLSHEEAFEQLSSVINKTE